MPTEIQSSDSQNSVPSNPNKYIKLKIMDNVYEIFYRTLSSDQGSHCFVFLPLTPNKLLKKLNYPINIYMFNNGLEMTESVAIFDVLNDIAIINNVSYQYSIT